MSALLFAPVTRMGPLDAVIVATLAWYVALARALAWAGSIAAKALVVIAREVRAFGRFVCDSALGACSHPAQRVLGTSRWRIR